MSSQAGLLQRASVHHKACNGLCLEQWGRGTSIPSLGLSCNLRMAMAYPEADDALFLTIREGWQNAFEVLLEAARLLAFSGGPNQ